MNASFPQFAGENFGTFNSPNMMHQNQQTISSAYGPDSCAELKLLYNPLFPATYVGYPYQPFSTDWMQENSHFLHGISKLHNECLTGPYFKGHLLINKITEKIESNHYNLPTFKADQDYDINLAPAASQRMSCFFQTFNTQWLGKRVLDNADYKQIRDKFEGKSPEVMLLNLLHMQMILLIEHHDAQTADSSLLPFFHNNELQGLLCRFMSDYTKCNFVFQHYQNIVRIDSPEMTNAYYLPRMKKALMHHYGIRNHLLNRLYHANILRATGQLTESLKELLELTRISSPPPGTCYPCESVLDEYPFEQESKSLNDFPDVRVSLILGLLACGYGNDCEQFIRKGCYISMEDQTFNENNYCRSVFLYGMDYQLLPEFFNFPESANRETVAQCVADYQNTLHSSQIKCPYACCSINRGSKILIKEEEFEFMDDSLSYRQTLSDSVRYTQDDEYLSQCDVSTISQHKGYMATCCEMSNIPRTLTQPEKYQVARFQANIFGDQETFHKGYNYVNEELPTLIPHPDFSVSETDIRRKNVEKIMARDHLVSEELPKTEIKCKTGIKRLALQHHSDELLSYDSYNCYLNQTYFLHNCTQNTNFASRDFQFVLQSFEHSQVSTFKFPEILFYGKYFDFENDKACFKSFPQQRPRCTGLRAACQESFDLTATTALYTLLLLELNKRALWANRIAKEISKSIAISACPCGIGQAQLPHFFGVKALAEISRENEQLNYLDQFLIEFPQPDDIDAALIYEAFDSNSFLPLYLLNVIPLPDVAMLRQMTHIFTVDEPEFQRTPESSIAWQESKQMQAALYTADFGHFWRADDLAMESLLKRKLDLIVNQDAEIIKQPISPCLIFIREAFDGFLEFELLEEVMAAAHLAASYYQEYSIAVGIHEKEESYAESSELSNMSSNHLLVPQSYVNLQNSNMSKANLYGMIFEKRLLAPNKQKDDYMAALNLNHGYINMQRNLTRVMGSLLEQVGTLEVNQIIQFVFNQVFSSFGQQEGATLSFEQYFSLELYNIIIEQIQKVLPQISELQEQPKSSTKSVKKGKKEQKKKDLKEFVLEQENVVVSDDDSIWKMMQENSGLTLNFALNQTLRQREILLENEQFIIEQTEQKENSKINFQGVTSIVYNFEMLIGQYFQLCPRDPGLTFLRSLVASMSLLGTDDLYAVYISQLLSIRDFAKAPKESATDLARFSGNANIGIKQTRIGTFWPAVEQFEPQGNAIGPGILESHMPPIHSGPENAEIEQNSMFTGSRNIVYCRVPDNLSEYTQFRQTGKVAEEWRNNLSNYISSGILRSVSVEAMYGRAQELNAMQLAVLSGNPALLYLEMLHYQFGLQDLLNALQLSCMAANPYIMRVVLNYQAQGFEKGRLEARIQEINTIRRKHNAQNQGHQLPLLRTDISGVIAERVCDIQEILTVYFADKEGSACDCEEPMYFSTEDIAAETETPLNGQAPETSENTQSESVSPAPDAKKVVLKPEVLEFRPEGPHQALQVFREAVQILQHSKHVQFLLLYYVLSNNSKFCVQNSCQCCKLYRETFAAMNESMQYQFSAMPMDRCIIQQFIEQKLSEVISNFTILKKNSVQEMMSRHVQMCVQMLTVHSNINQYIIMKRGKAINLTQLKLENTALLRLEEINFIPMTTPLTLASQLYSEGLEELVIQYKKDLQEGSISKSYFNHRDGLGLTAINHCCIVFCFFAAKMLKYQAEIDEYQRESAKQAAFSEEMRNIKHMFREAHENFILLLQNGANTFIQDNIGLTPRDRIIFFILKHRICTIDDTQIAILGKNTELLLNYVYFENDAVVKAEIDQVSTGSKKIMVQYSTTADERHKQRFQQLGGQLSQQMRLKDVFIGLDLEKYKSLLQIETGEMDFAKPVYEAMATIIHYLGAEEQPTDYGAYCAGHQAESGDIYMQVPRQITVGAPVISYRDFERFERGEDYCEEKLPDHIRVHERAFLTQRGNLQFFCRDDCSEPLKKVPTTRSFEISSTCNQVLQQRVAYRLWRTFDADRSGVNILRAGRNVLNSVNVVTRSEKVIHRVPAAISDDCVIYELRRASNRCCFVAQVVNKTSQCQVSLYHHPRAISLEECSQIARLFEIGSTLVCQVKGACHSSAPRPVVRIVSNAPQAHRRTLASVIGNSEAVNARLFASSGVVSGVSAAQAMYKGTPPTKKQVK